MLMVSVRQGGIQMRKGLIIAVLCLSNALSPGCMSQAKPRPTSIPSATPRVVENVTFTPGETSVPTEAGPLYWWNDRVFYEIFVRSFYDSDGDGTGDLQGLIDKLDYLNDGDPETTDDLGITGIWLMPIFESPSYHGYDVVDYHEIESDYGDSDTFRRFLAEAHARGIRVIVDLVLNHTSSEHPWFLDAASGPNAEHRDWYIWSLKNPGYSGPWGEPVWHLMNGQYYYGVFWSGMPDLNYRNEEVTMKMQDIARFWLEEMGVDGFRLDAIKHLIEEGRVQENTKATHEWLRGFYQFHKGINEEALTVGEVWDETSQILPYYGQQVDMCFEFNLAEAILRSVREEDPRYLQEVQAEVESLYPYHQYATFLTNHDQDRVMTQLGGDWEMAKLAATIYLTMPGVPFIYYGEEIGMKGKKPDEYIRTPMQWTSGANAGFSPAMPWKRVNLDYETKNVETQLADPDSLLNHYRKLIYLRSEHAALPIGIRIPLQCSRDEVYAYLRQWEGEDILVLLNFSGRAIHDYQLTLAESDILAGAYSPRDLLNDAKVAELTVNANGGFSNYQPVSVLEPHGGYIILLQPNSAD